MRVIRKKHVKLPTSVGKGPTQVKVGFPSGKVASDVINKAVWNEFGTAGNGMHFVKANKAGKLVRGFGGPVPERPFFRNSMRNNRGKYLKMIRSAAAQILLGKISMEMVLNRLGAVAAADVKAEIIKLNSPPNAALTIELKGSSNPLVDSGQLAASPTWEVKK